MWGDARAAVEGALDMSVVTTTEPCQDLACIVSWADHWQTLLGAAIAIPLAAAAILVPIVQEWKRLGRVSDALRATLPMRLSALAAYALAAARAVGNCRTAAGTSAVAIAAFVPPEVPAGLVDGLERTIEALRSRRVNRRLARIIGEVQVLNARMSTIREDLPDAQWLDSVLVQTGTIHAQAESLFDYARRRSEGTARRIAWREVAKALNIAGLRTGSHPDVHKLIERYAGYGWDPEQEDPRVLGWRRALLWLKNRWRERRNPTLKLHP